MCEKLKDPEGSIMGKLEFWLPFYSSPSPYQIHKTTEIIYLP